MKIDTVEIIRSMHGKVCEDGKFYLRRSPSGRLYACKCPDRSKHVPTPAEKANQIRFANTYARKQ